ncbi:MAG TPA: AsmA-like C-terminal region-containing protein [Methylotenera sp.]|nr:AsmA-like C-terminal region-containing protein [Methylotenera sp.]
MDLSAIYSKTPKGLRTRSSLIGGLSSHLMKVLTHVDGSSSAETILLKLDKLTPQQLTADLTRLEQEGYIRLATTTSTADDSWSLTVNFEPMVVEEFQSEEELEVSAQAKTAEQTRQIELEQAKQEEERRLAEQLKADKLRDNERIKAETKVIAQMEQERLEQEAARREAEAEAQLKARQEAERIEQQQAAERAAKLVEETRLQAELKAREVAQAEAEVAAKEARREMERISREAEEAQKKADIEAKAKQERERLDALNMARAAEDARQAELKAQAEYQAQLEQAAKAAAEQARLEVEAAEQAAETKRLKQAEKAAQAAALKEKLEQEKARLEIAIVLRKAEEDRKNAEAQAKAEKLEAKRRLKAEQDARAQAERKAKEESKEIARQQKLKAQAEEKAKAEASEQAQLEAARIAKGTEIARKIALENERLQAKQAADALAAQAEVEQTQRLERENQVQLAAEAVRAHLLAEERANLAAKQNAQLEMERIGREADKAHQKAAQQQQSAKQQNTLVQQIATAQQNFLEIEKSEPDKELPDAEDFDAAEDAAFEAEERAAEAKVHPKLEKTTKQATVDSGRTDIKNAAMTAAAAAMASIHGKARSFLSAKKIKHWLGSFTKAAFIYVPVLLLLVLLVLSFINLSFLIKPIEKMASESIGETVVIKNVHASLWPQPNLVLEDVAIGTGNNIEAVHVLPVIASLFEEVKVVKSLVIEGLNIEQANFNQSLQWASNASKAKRLKVEQINLKNLTLVIRDLQLEPFDGKVMLTDAGALSSIELVSSDNALSVRISPQGNDSEIVLKATNWVLPFNQKIVFGTLNAKGLASQYKLNFSQIEGEIFGGSLTGQANIEWPDGAGQWLSAGEFKLLNANTEALLNNFGSAVTIDGKLALDARFSGEAREVSKLASNTITDANFDVRQGSIHSIELVRGVLSPSGQSLAGGNTNFDKLTGSIKLNQNEYQFSKLVLASSQFNANGFVNIDANQISTGRVHADLAAQSRHLKADFDITGRGEDLRSN